MDANFMFGIDANDSLGIDANDTFGIDANDSFGIDANDAFGIDANDSLGIDANDMFGIDANDSLGIDANDAFGIDANDSFGIDANDAFGIDANDSLGIDANDMFGIDANDSLGIDANDVLSGPVDRIDTINGVFESMGQIVMASRDALASMNVGDFVSVQGSVVGPGWLYADGVSVSNAQYVPGATEVFVTGMLSSVDRAAGIARMGGLTIDYTSSLGAGRAPSEMMWSFSGTRPVSSGVMISDRTGGLR